MRKSFLRYENDILFKWEIFVPEAGGNFCLFALFVPCEFIPDKHEAWKNTRRLLSLVGEDKVFIYFQEVRDVKNFLRGNLFWDMKMKYCLNETYLCLKHRFVFICTVCTLKIHFLGSTKLGKICNEVRLIGEDKVFIYFQELRELRILMWGNLFSKILKRHCLQNIFVPEVGNNFYA